MDRPIGDLSDLPPSYEEATGRALKDSQPISGSQQRSTFEQERPLQSGHNLISQSNLNNNTPQVHVARTIIYNDPNRIDSRQLVIREIPATTNTSANCSFFNGLFVAGTVCPSCRQHVRFRHTTESNLKTHALAFVLFALGCFVCSCLPYLMTSCKTVHFYCSNCNYYLGSCDGLTGQRL